MTDRQLLEAAARAAGMKVFLIDGALRDCTGFAPAMNAYAGAVWNPLADDGDALRLAVKLRIDLEWTRDERDRAGASKPHTVAWGENAGADPYAATRRAIVRAAAAMAERGE